MMLRPTKMDGSEQFLIRRRQMRELRLLASFLVLLSRYLLALYIGGARFTHRSDTQMNMHICESKRCHCNFV